MFTNTTGYHIEGTCDGEITWPLTTADLEGLQSFTVRALVSIHEVLDGDEVITDQYINACDGVPDVVIPKELEVPLESWSWTLEQGVLSEMQSEEALSGQRSFESEQFGMFGMDCKWFLEIYPNGDSEESAGHTVFKLHVVRVSEEVTVLCVRYTICVKETDTKFISEGMFGGERTVSSWGMDRIPTEKFKNLDSLAITVELELVDVYRRDIADEKKMGSQDGDKQETVT